jgi:uncharacterized caspase-like protein
MKRPSVILLTAWMLALATSAFGSSAQRGITVAAGATGQGVWGDYHALIVGINDYQKWPRLQTAVKDATVLRDLLVSRYGFNPENVILRTDREASRQQINRDLRYLAQSMRPDDNLLVYYAGHGQLDDLTGDGYWVPAEGAMKDPSTWVANSYVKAILSSEKVQAKNVVVIADSCYSGSMLRGGPSLMSMDDQRYREKLVEKAALRSRQVISSGGVEPVADGGAEGHSLFAFYLIDALRKNDREVIDLENLFHTKVWKPVTEIGDQRPNVGRLKTPMDQDGQFVLYNAAWARERAAQQAVVAAKEQKQARARRQAAVASAELELQRQRIEMEKQKLALEREQLAHQKALEMERLKIEKQKQDIEYARLQARLSEMEAKEKANEDLARRSAGKNEQLLAAVAPATTKPPRAPEGGYRLAIFPLNFFTADFASSHVQTYERETLQKIAAIAAENSRLTLAYSYQAIEGSVGQVMLLGDMLPNHKIDVWKKKNIFSKSEPDWKKIRRIGKELGANPIVLGTAEIGVGNIEFYVYDTENDRIYPKKTSANWMIVPDVAQKLVENLLKEFLLKQ